MVALASNRILHGHRTIRAAHPPVCAECGRRFVVAQIKTIGFVSVTSGPIERECHPGAHLDYLTDIVPLPLAAHVAPVIAHPGRTRGPECREMDRETDGEKYGARRSKQVSCTKVSTESGHSNIGHPLLSRSPHFVTALREQHLKTRLLAPSNIPVHPKTNVR